LHKDLGDFQTPFALVEQVLNCLHRSGDSWERVLEPTCGVGNFIRGLVDHAKIAPHADIQGIELQPDYVVRAAAIHAENARIFNDNIFNFDLKTLTWQRDGRLLVVGNPPWVTKAALGVLSSENTPMKQNLKSLSGLDALTGASNFDIAEAIWIKLLSELADQQPTIALLCKMSVARNVLSYAAKMKLPIHAAEIRKIDAHKWFGAAVGACLLIVHMGDNNRLVDVPIYADLISYVSVAQFRVRDSSMNLTMDRPIGDDISMIDGVSPLEWRQGVKHDAASVMELRRDLDGRLWNKLGECVDVEADYVYPLLKSTDLYHGRVHDLVRAVIMPQSYIGEATQPLQHHAPRLWDYLNRNDAAFERRKSSIYVNRPRFSIFGVGDYTFKPYKIAISGLHKTPRFATVGQFDARPVVFDDTCYFIGCDSPHLAALVTTLLNQPICLQFLDTVTFADAKRPITKKVLQRIDLGKLLQQVDQTLLLEATAVRLEQIDFSYDMQTADWEAVLHVLSTQPTLI